MMNLPRLFILCFVFNLFVLSQSQGYLFGQANYRKGFHNHRKIQHSPKIDLGQPFVFFNGSPMMPYPFWDGMIDHRYGVHRPHAVAKVPITTDKNFVSQYRQPIARSADSLPFPNIPTKAAAFSAQQRAEAEFRDGNYESASRLARQVVILDPENGLARLFAAQTLFAIEDYPAAVRDIKYAIGLLPPRDWDSVVRDFRLYYGKNDYVQQMERLDNYLLKFPTHREGHLLRGYHLASLGYADAAVNDLQHAIAVRADERMATDLLKWVRGENFLSDDSQIDPPLPWHQFDNPRPSAVPPILTVPPEPEGQSKDDLPSFEELPLPLSDGY